MQSRKQTVPARPDVRARSTKHGTHMENTPCIHYAASTFPGRGAPHGFPAGLLPELQAELLESRSRSGIGTEQVCARQMTLCTPESCIDNVLE